MEEEPQQKTIEYKVSVMEELAASQLEGSGESPLLSGDVYLTFVDD